MKHEDLEKLNRDVDRHRGSIDEWLDRHARVCRAAVSLGDSGIALVLPHLFARVTDDRNLNLAWEHVSRSGPAPGLDGETIGTLGYQFDFTRGLRDALRSGTYQHGGSRVVRRLKASGTGIRKYSIPNVIDRIVQRGVVQVIQPLLDPMFDEHSFGYRPGLGRMHALAAAECEFEEGRWIGIAEDLKDAFNAVPQTRLMDIVSRYLHEAQIVGLIEHIVRATGKHGIGQGGPLSPLLLNLYLHHVLDRHWRKHHPSVTLLRYADDLLLCSHRMPRAIAARESLEGLVRSAGFSLKAATAVPHELEGGEQVDWLGFRIQWTSFDGLTVTVGNAGWHKLERSMEKAIADRGSHDSLSETIESWISQQGPAYSRRHFNENFKRLEGLLSKLQCPKRLDCGAVQRQWMKAHAKWHQVRSAARRLETPF